MRVTFTRLDAKRYAIAFRKDGPRDRGIDLPAIPGPGAAAFPHDLIHLIVEEQLGLELGIFGQMAAGGGSKAFMIRAFDRSGVTRQRSERLRLAGRSDMRMSELVTSLVGIDGELDPSAVAVIGDPRVAERLRGRLRRVFAEWSKVAVGQGLELEWPTELTRKNARPAKPSRNRRHSDPGDRRGAHLHAGRR